MTQTILERAARAAHDYAKTPYGSSDPMPESWRLNGWHYQNIARAVLMAVREPTEAMSQAVRTTEGWEDMIDFVLNEPQP